MLTTLQEELKEVVEKLVAQYFHSATYVRDSGWINRTRHPRPRAVAFFH